MFKISVESARSELGFGRCFGLVRDRGPPAVDCEGYVAMWSCAWPARSTKRRLRQNLASSARDGPPFMLLVEVASRCGRARPHRRGTPRPPRRPRRAWDASCRPDARAQGAPIAGRNVDGNGGASSPIARERIAVPGKTRLGLRPPFVVDPRSSCTDVRLDFTSCWRRGAQQDLPDGQPCWLRCEKDQLAAHFVW